MTPSKECEAQERILPDSIHYELQYLDLMRRIWTEGDERVDRTGVGTRSLFGEMMRFSLADDAIPLLTTKRVYWKTALRELLWFLTGDTSIRPLVAQGVRIWTDWPLDRYRRETGETISAEDFEARILADDAFAKPGATWVRCTATSGSTGRAMRSRARGFIAAPSRGTTRLPR